MIPRISSPAAARLFLACLALAGAAAAWAGVRPESLVSLPCPVRLLAGVPCPGCGMTRAFLALLGGDVAAAWAYNPFFMAPAAVALGASLPPSRPRALLASAGRRVAPLALVLALCWWIRRLEWTAL